MDKIKVINSAVPSIGKMSDREFFDFISDILPTGLYGTICSGCKFGGGGADADDLGCSDCADKRNLNKR